MTLLESANFFQNITEIQSFLIRCPATEALTSQRSCQVRGWDISPFVKYIPRGSFKQGEGSDRKGLYAKVKDGVFKTFPGEVSQNIQGFQFGAC